MQDHLEELPLERVKSMEQELEESEVREIRLSECMLALKDQENGNDKTRQGSIEIKQLVAQRIADTLAAYEANRNSSNMINNKTSGSAGGVEHKTHGWTDIIGYTKRFQELALLCPGMVMPEDKKIERLYELVPYLTPTGVNFITLDLVRCNAETARELVTKLGTAGPLLPQQLKEPSDNSEDTT
ncbi:hypothetical protein Tco_1044189 [Tanacetum coccineum]|uniref:Uncharacterized protein n=1 Tax=Tanacetum coccineum TaxID=301880 RepID=A0ABQ5GQE7_9ASTR